MNGVVYAAFGKSAIVESGLSAASLKKHNDLPVTIINECHQDTLTDSQKARWVKTNLPILCEYDKVLYLDADTRVRGDITAGFELLDNFDLVIAPSRNQDTSIFTHLRDEDEKQETLREIGNWQPIQLQAGVMFFDRQRCTRLFREWNRQWLRWQDQDQAALLRALAIEPVRVWLLGRDYNGGQLVEHLFGRV